jgi:TatD DNase family protein
MRLFDAHNHIQDQRFGVPVEALLHDSQRVGVIANVVNGTSPSDWDRVLQLAAQHSIVVPSLGVHPWYIQDLPHDWFERLSGLIQTTQAGVGEVGIDGWRKEFDPAAQEDIFIRQLVLAAEYDRPISIHGLRRWGRLLELLKKYPRPRCGFLLHSYGGPREMIADFTKLGGYFSCPGFFLSPGREMKLNVFRDVPSERLLLETDAPDQKLPEHLDDYNLASSVDGTRINHPATILRVYEGMAALRGTTLKQLAECVERNFHSLFGNILPAASACT